MAKGLAYIHQHGSITNGEYRGMTGTSEATARRDLDLLVERGSIRAVGTKKGRKYIL